MPRNAELGWAVRASPRPPVGVPGTSRGRGQKPPCQGSLLYGPPPEWGPSTWASPLWALSAFCGGAGLQGVGVAAQAGGGCGDGLLEYSTEVAGRRDTVALGKAGGSARS